MKLRLLSADDIRRALPMRDCIAVMKQAFADFSAGRAEIPQRVVFPVGEEGTVLVKPGHLPGRALGAKIVSVFPGNASRDLPVVPGLVVLLDLATGIPTALLDGTFLTAWRTGAAGGAATDLLAAPDASVGALFGAGDQAVTQLLAMDAVRDFEEIRVYARTPATREAFVDRYRDQVDARLVAVDSPTAAVERAQVVTAATTSNEPVFAGIDLTPGTHVTGVGSFTPDASEVDLDTVARSRIYVDSVASCTQEPGDLVQAIAAGVTHPSEWTELGNVEEQGGYTHDPAGLTFFKSVGLAVQDLAAGSAVLRVAEDRGFGTKVDL